MKKILLLSLALILSPSGFTKVEEVRNCLNQALVKSMNMKLQNLSQNNSIDEEITFSCSNINAKGKHELLTIRKDKIKVINQTINKLSQNGSVHSLEIARLNAEFGNKDVSINDMCPMIQANYESQIRRVAKSAFSSNLKKCPQISEQFQREYLKIMSSPEVVTMPLMDACSSLVGKIRKLKETFQDKCSGNVSEKPKYKKFGQFGKVTIKKGPTNAQILQFKILKAFKSKRTKYIA